MTSTNPFRLTELDPADWTILGYFYQGTSADLADAYAADWRELDEALGALNLGWTDILTHDNGGCAHCGARFLHGAVAYRAADRTALAIGHTCANERFGLTVKADLVAKYGAAKQAAERRQRAERFAALCAEHEGLVEAFETDHYIVRDIRSAAFRFGNISPKQLALVLKIARETAERAAQDAERVPKAEPCPTGRIVVTGVVISTRWYDNDFGGALKWVVQDERGFRVFGTVPSAVDASKGDRVTFTATLEQSKDDALFGFAKRPTKATVLTPAEAA